MAKIVFDACVKTGTYYKDGQEKARWLQIGKVFENEKGLLNLKLEALPLKGSDDCWIKLFPAKGKGNG